MGRSAQNVQCLRVSKKKRVYKCLEKIINKVCMMYTYNSFLFPESDIEIILGQLVVSAPICCNNR